MFFHGYLKSRNKITGADHSLVGLPLLVSRSTVGRHSGPSVNYLRQIYKRKYEPNLLMTSPLNKPCEPVRKFLSNSSSSARILMKIRFLSELSCDQPLFYVSSLVSELFFAPLCSPFPSKTFLPPFH